MIDRGIPARPRPLLERRVLFFGGKGGVGKTTVASAFAVAAADAGLKTLLVSTDPAHSTSDVFERSVGPEPTPITEHLFALEIDPEREAEQYVNDVKARIADATPPRLVAEVERQIDIARVSPGAEEAALFDRFTRLLEHDGAFYDRIIFDTAPTGHTLRLLALPEHMTLWMSGLISRRKKVNALGRMWRTVAGAAAGSDVVRDDPVLAALTERRHRFEHARTVMTDRAQTAFVFVIVPERLPILETERALRVLEKYGIPVGGVIVNRILPDVDETFIKKRRQREAEYLRTIETTFEAVPLLHLPLFETDIAGLAALRALAAVLPPSERLAS
jgi:arsenite/tail-anchored protein-transporting ATPase